MKKIVLIFSVLFLVIATHFMISKDGSTTNPSLSVKERTQLYENKVKQLAPQPKQPSASVKVFPTSSQKTATQKTPAQSEEEMEAELAAMPLPKAPTLTYAQVAKLPDEQLKKFRQTEKNNWLLDAPLKGTTISRLIAIGANVNIRNDQLQSPLVRIISSEWIAPKTAEDIVNLLLKQPNIDIELRDNSGKTALMYAAALHKINIVEKLLNFYKNAARRAAYVNKKDLEGRTALQQAINAVKTLLLSKPEDKNKKLVDLKQDSAYRDYITIIQLLLDNGAQAAELIAPTIGPHGEKIQEVPAVLTELYQQQQAKMQPKKKMKDTKKSAA